MSDDFDCIKVKPPIRTDLSSADIKPLYTRIAMVLLGGFKLKRAAELLGVSANTVYRLWSNPDFRSYYRDLEVQRNGIAVENTAVVEQIFQAHAEDAALHLVTMMESEQDTGKKKALADDILDRAGFAGKQRMDINAGKPIRIVLEDSSDIAKSQASFLDGLTLEDTRVDDASFERDIKDLAEN